MISLDVATLIAVIASPFALLAVIIALFLWIRSEASADRRQFHQEAAADRRDLLQLIREIKEELKDFHGRLERHDAEFKSHLMHCHDIGKK